MARSKTIKDAVRSIERHGVCLVFPIDNAKAPASLWYDFYPKSKMRWEWDDSGDNRVADLWHLREELSRSKKVVYAKWFRGRATFFSRALFTRLVAALNFSIVTAPRLSPSANKILQILDESSPLSTKELKLRAELKGKAQEGVYTKSTKVLWERLLIVGFGEVDDGAFPSLAVGSTENLFEDLWEEARRLKSPTNEKELALWGQLNPLFFKFFEKLRKNWNEAPADVPPVDSPSKKLFVWPGILKS